MKETVLLVFSPSSANSNALISGVSAYAHQRKWRIHMIDRADRKTLTDAIEFFHPVGCLIGGHNNLAIFTSSEPTITSIAPNFERGGYLAAHLPDERIANPNMKPTTRWFHPMSDWRKRNIRG